MHGRLPEAHPSLSALRAEAPALEWAGFWVATLGLDGRCLHMSPDFQEALGLTEPPRSWDGLVEALHPEDRASLVAWLAEGAPGGIPCRVWAPRGETRELRLHRLQGEGGTWHLLVLDDSESHRARASLSHLRLGASGLSGEAFFQAMVVNLAAAFGAPYALAGELVGTDRIRALAFCDHGELAPPLEYELRGTPCQDVVEAKVCFHPTEVARLYPADAMLTESGIQGYLGSSLVDSRGRVLGILCVMSQGELEPHPWMLDLLSAFCARTSLELERIRNEEALRQSQQLLQGLERMNAMASLGAGLAHDLNNLLAVIQNYAELCGEDVAEGQMPDPSHLRRVKEAALRAGALTAQLLSYGRSRKGQVERFEVGERLAHLAELLKAALPRQVTLQVDPAPGLLWMEADPAQVDQMVANLVLNARDALPKGGCIGLRCQVEPEGTLRLTVVDDGVGMPPEVVARLGEPFFTTKGEGRGTGLGLASVKSILDRLGGHLAVESTQGAGTAFHLHLPLLREP